MTTILIWIGVAALGLVTYRWLRLAWFRVTTLGVITVDLDYQAGTESLEVSLFTESEIPWGDIAFPTVGHALKCFFEDLHRIRSNGGIFALHTRDIRTPMRQRE